MLVQKDTNKIVNRSVDIKTEDVVLRPSHLIILGKDLLSSKAQNSVPLLSHMWIIVVVVSFIHINSDH